MSGWFERGKEAVHAVGVAYSLGSLAALSLEVFLVHRLSASAILVIWIGAGATIGAITGFFRTAFKFAGRGRDRCLRVATRYLVLSVVLYFVLLVVPLTTLNVSVAERYDTVRKVRELLLISTPFLNSFLGFGAAITAFFFVGAIVLFSPGVANPKKPVHRR